jgi:hypothetical protein
MNILERVLEEQRRATREGVNCVNFDMSEAEFEEFKSLSVQGGGDFVNNGRTTDSPFSEIRIVVEGQLRAIR